jgi:glycerol-3-phosphate acyltransferase PlsY
MLSSFFEKTSRSPRGLWLYSAELRAAAASVAKDTSANLLIMTWIGPFQPAVALHALACVVGAYTLGCFGIGYYLVRARTGRDIREIGSGSVGARNVGRVLGLGGLCVTLLADFTKGGLAVWAARQASGSERLAGLALLAVSVGHIWPLQLGFRGGKGVATSLGGLLIFDWHSALIYAAVFAVLFALMRRTILPGLLAYLVLPFTLWWFRQDGVQVALVGGLIAVVWYAHRENLVVGTPELAGRRRAEPHPNEPPL